jgi:hypothetical protein
MRSAATYFHGDDLERGELWLEDEGLSFYRRPGNGGFTSSLAALGFNMSSRAPRAFVVPWREILRVYVNPDWLGGFFVETPYGQLAFGVPDPFDWVLRLAR